MALKDKKIGFIGLGAAPVVAPMICGVLLLAGEPALVFAVVAIPAAALIAAMLQTMEVLPTPPLPLIAIFMHTLFQA